MKNKKLFLLPLLGMLVVSCNSAPIIEDNDEEIVENDFTLSMTSLNMFVGETKQIFANTNPKSQICSWSSSNDSVAKINTLGQISAIAEGQSVISAKVGEITHTCNVVVSLDDIKLNKTTLSLNIEDTPTYQFSCSYVHSSASPLVTWSVDNESIATVNTSGLVTLKGIGEANVIAKLTDEITASCKITVSGPEGYYALESGQNATVIANPGKWYYHTAGNASHFSATYSNGKATLVMDSNGASETYLRYMPENTPDVFKAQATITVSKACVIRLGGGLSNEYSYVSFDSASTKTVEWEHRHNEKNCLSVLVLNSASGSDYAKNYTIEVSTPTVSNDIALNVSEISLDLESNNIFQLTPAGGETYSYVSSNPEIASVSDEGLITAVSNGNATITVTSGTMTVACNVSVKSCEILITEAYHVFENSNQWTIPFTTSNIENESEIVWTSSNESVASVNAGVVTPHNGGTAVITATYNGVSSSTKAVIVDDSSLIGGNQSISAISGTIENPGVFYKYQTYINTAELADDELVLTNTDKKIDTTASSNRVQQIRYCVKDGAGNFYKGQYYICCEFENNTRTQLNDGEPTNAKLTITNGADTSISQAQLCETGNTVKFGIVLSANGTGNTYTKFSFKSFGYGTMVVRNIHVVLMGE